MIQSEIPEFCVLYSRGKLSLGWFSRTGGRMGERGTAESQKNGGMGIFQIFHVAVGSSAGTGELQLLGQKCKSRLFSRNVWAVFWMIGIMWSGLWNGNLIRNIPLLDAVCSQKAILSRGFWVRLFRAGSIHGHQAVLGFLPVLHLRRRKDLQSCE